jgi:hypothetical protein
MKNQIRTIIKNNNTSIKADKFVICAIKEYEGWNGNSYIDEIQNIEDLVLDQDLFYHVYGESDGRFYFIESFDSLEEAKQFVNSIRT